MTFACQILTLYPEMFPGPLGQSIAGRALTEGKWSCDAVQIRDFATDKHRSVDDTPAGGGAGMVLKPDVLAARSIMRWRAPRRAGSGDDAARPAADQARVRSLAAGRASRSCAAVSRDLTSAFSRRGDRAGLDRRLCPVGRRDGRAAARRLHSAASRRNGRGFQR
jgi:hypothetical protein